MSALRIFVSYALTGDERGATVARQLINDLQANGANVITDQATIPEEHFVKYLQAELPRCQYLILMQTPEALESLRVQTAINLALNMVAQQRMKGVLRMIAVPGPHSTDEDEQPLWVSPRAFDASRDYPRARDKVLLELDLLKLDEDAQEPVNQVMPFLQANSTIKLSPEDTGSLADLSLHDETIIDTLPLAAVLSNSNPAQRDRQVTHSPRHRAGWWAGLTAIALLLILGTTVGAIALRSPNHGIAVVVPPTSVSVTPMQGGTPTMQATRQASNRPTATPVSTATITIGSVSLATPTPVPVTIVDNVNDWSKTTSHTSNLGLDQNNSEHMHGDTSLVIRNNTNAASVVWKLEGMTSFQAITYFWPPQDSAPLSDLQIYTSADGVHWNTTKPILLSSLSSDGNIWSIYTYSLTNLSNVNYVEMHWFATSDEYWGQQIGQVTLKS